MATRVTGNEEGNGKGGKGNGNSNKGEEVTKRARGAR
jgi:hypothetical protein